MGATFKWIAQGVIIGAGSVLLIMALVYKPMNKWIDAYETLQYEKIWNEVSTLVVAGIEDITGEAS